MFISYIMYIFYLFCSGLVNEISQAKQWVVPNSKDIRRSFLQMIGEIKREQESLAST